MKFSAGLNSQVGKYFMVAMMVFLLFGCVAVKKTKKIEPYFASYEESNYKGQTVLINKVTTSGEVTPLPHFKNHEYRPPSFSADYLRELLQKELLKYEILSTYQKNSQSIKFPVINMSLKCWEGKKDNGLDISKDYVRLCEVTLSALSPSGELIYAVPQKDFYYDTSKFFKYSRPELGRDYESSVADRMALVKNLVIKSVEKFNEGYGLDY